VDAPGRLRMADEDAGEEGKRQALKKRRRGRQRIALVVALVVILIPALYLFVIPRTEISVRVFYNESVLNQINVDPQITNSGTNEATAVTLTIAVVNSTDHEMGKKEYSIGEIEPVMGIAKLDALTFRGSQYERYTIVIDIELNAGGTTLSRHWSHNTEEPYLNLDWTDKVA
jgi:hypothetical protein